MSTPKAQLWVIGGPNGAGKSTLVSHRLARKIPVINPDDIANELRRVDGKLDERQAGMIALQSRATFLREQRDFAIETTLTGHSALRFIERARQADYKATLVFVGLRNAGLSAHRVADRVRRGGHTVPVSALVRRYPDALRNLARAINSADRSYVFDNSAERRRLLLIIEDGRTRFLARHLPLWFRAALPERAASRFQAEGDPHDQ